ncbi:MAG: hypothetical protein WBM09_02670 [Gallionella sp.]
MTFSRCILLFASLLFAGLPAGGYAAQHAYGIVTKAEKELRGTWYSAKNSITFSSNGTVRIKGKRYFYAVSDGGMIQLSGNNSSDAISYQLFGGQLTLTIDGNTTVYTRKRPTKK